MWALQPPAPWLGALVKKSSKSLAEGKKEEERKEGMAARIEMTAGGKRVLFKLRASFALALAVKHAFVILMIDPCCFTQFRV